jgi:membrane-bound lytic murein transglycosylase D
MRAADAAKKVGMGENEFRAINNIPARMLIKPGSALLVPRAAHIEQDVAGSVADTGQMSLAPEMVLKRTTVKAGQGETVASVAHKFKVTPASVAQWNGVSASAGFKAKQQIVLYLPASSGKKASGKSLPVKKPKKK